MLFTMRLTPVPFEKMRNGEKTIELRLYDKKRRAIAVGDRIEFVNLGNPEEMLLTQVIGIYPFKSFAQLYIKLPLLECGYSSNELKTASPKDMEQFYTAEDQEKYGVVGIQIKLLEHYPLDETLLSSGITYSSN